MEFNPKPGTVMHIDLNSCFATIEQQANPRFRGKPLAVAAYASPGGCILAPSIEAKTYGIKTGMRVRDGKVLCPHLIVLPPDPPKYRFVHLGLRHILAKYTDRVHPKSIDEFVLNFGDSPCLKMDMHNIGREIKRRIRQELGDWLTVSVGIGPNRFLAKTAAGLKKPDGLEEINKDNHLEVYSRLSLQDLCGIARHNEIRLNRQGIYSVLDLYNADVRLSKLAFSSILGYYWYVRLRGWEIDEVEFARRSYGNSYALPIPFVQVKDLAPILQKLVEKMSGRFRKAGYKASGISLYVSYRDNTFWHKSLTLKRIIFESREVFAQAYKLLEQSERKPVRNLAVSCFNLHQSPALQLELLEDVVKKENLARAVDMINERWGSFSITPLRMLPTQNNVPDRIAFGGVKELEEFTVPNQV